MNGLTLARATDLVAPFVSTDETRPHLCKAARYTERVVGTDGHTLATVRFVDAPNSADTLARTYGPGEAAVPPYEYVIPAGPKCFGMWNPASTPELAHYPSKWNVFVQFGGGRGTEPTVEAYLPAKTGRHGKVLRPAINMIRAQAIDGLDEIGDGAPERIGVAACYLLRVAEFFSHGPVHVYGNGPLDPLVFTAESVTPSKASFLALPGFAIVMPMRV